MCHKSSFKVIAHGYNLAKKSLKLIGKMYKIIKIHWENVCLSQTIKNAPQVAHSGHKMNESSAKLAQRTPKVTQATP